jgi:hypothetical protein
MPVRISVKAAGEQNCLIALFLGKVENMLKKCKRFVLNGSFEPVIGFIVLILLNKSQYRAKR